MYLGFFYTYLGGCVKAVYSSGGDRSICIISIRIVLFLKLLRLVKIQEKHSNCAKLCLVLSWYKDGHRAPHAELGQNEPYIMSNHLQWVSEVRSHKLPQARWLERWTPIFRGYTSWGLLTSVPSNL